MEEIITAGPELISIIERNFESKGLDYKAPIRWDPNDKKACCEITKDIIGMANTEGGYLVLGVSESDHGFVLEGLNLEQVKSFESSIICRFVQNYVDPPINVRVQKVLHKQKAFVLLEIPRFTDTPHICQKEYPGVLHDRELYVRTDNNETAPIKSSADFRMLIESAIRNRTDSLLSSFRAILTGAGAKPSTESTSEQQFAKQVERARASFAQRNPLKQKNYTFLVETIFSLQEFDQYRFPKQRIEQSAYKACVDFVGWPFLFIHHNRPDCLSRTDDGLESLFSDHDFAGNDMLDFWRLNESGLFFKMDLPFMAASKPPQASVPDICRHFAEAVFCLTKLYEDLLSDSDVISLRAIFHGTRGRVLTWNHPAFPYGTQYEANRPELTVEMSRTFADWRAGIEDHSVELARNLLTGFHWQPDLQQVRTYIQKVFQRRF